MTLNDLRAKIDEIDLKIKELFLQRMKTAEEVAECKSKTGDKILKPRGKTRSFLSLQRKWTEN